MAASALTCVGGTGIEPVASSVSGKPGACVTILDPVPELALSSAAVRRCMPAAVVVVTQLDTQLTCSTAVVDELRQGWC